MPTKFWNDKNNNKYINAYFKKFPEIKDYMNSTISICRKQGYVTIFLEEEFILEELMIKILVLEVFKNAQQLMPQSRVLQQILLD